MSLLRAKQQRPVESNRPVSISRIISRSRAGEVVPIISDIVSNDMVFGQGKHRNFITAYTEAIVQQPGYHAPNLERLSWITQYSSVTRSGDSRALKEEFAGSIKEWIINLAETQGADPETVAAAERLLDKPELLRFCDVLGYPRFTQERENPLMVLANLNLPIFITTSYDYFIEMALRQAGKTPRTAVYPWRKGIDARTFWFDQAYQRQFDLNHYPSVEQPLVYHLHGLFDFPLSMVVTEDDYMEFLTEFVRARSGSNDPFLSAVRIALESKTLLLLGYKLRNWDFRTLFWGVIKSETQKHDDLRHTCVQLEPDDVDSDYLQKYLDRARFDVFKGDIYAFAQELA